MSEKLEGGIYKKILKVMDDVKYLNKDDTISYKDVRYKGLSEEKVTGKIRERLVAYNVVVFPIAQIHHREGTLTTVDVTYRFVDTDDGSYFDAVSSGTGSDTQDKGVGKAMTYAYKYLWLRTFAIPTGEDPDKVSSAELDDKQEDDRLRKGKASVLQLLEDNPELEEQYRDSTALDVDEAVSSRDIQMLGNLYREVQKEIEKMHRPEVNEMTKKGFKKASEMYVEKQAQQPDYVDPDIPDSEATEGDLF